MPRGERPLGDGDEPLLRFARDLRSLRERAGRPTYRELSGRAHYSAATLSQAAAGHKLPSLPVTLAYVGACDGPVEEWERRWCAVADETRPAEPDEDDADSPYVGLVSFQPTDAERFFGRECLVEQLLASVARRRVVVLVGASGTGKSSLLRAGLVPRLAGPVVLFTPGEHPLEECVLRVGNVTGTPVTRLADDPRALYRVVRQAAPDGGELVLVVDQFEEVFTLCPDRAERAAFIDQLLTAANGGCRVVLGVRADFYTHCTAFPELLAVLRDGQVTVGAMTPDELRQAITQPAVRSGHTVETALVAELVATATGELGVLPMLSHALLETWRRRRGNTLTLRGFHDAGGIRGALANTAESVWARMAPHQRDVVRALFLRLTALGEGTEDTKRRITIDELDDDEDTALVIAQLARARLLTLDHDLIEISHEALIRCWPRLGDWLTTDRERLRAHRQLVEATAIWESLGHEPGALYRGARLELVRDWLDHDPGMLTARERDFLATSVAEQAAETAAARRQTRRLRQLVALLTVLLGFAVTVTAVAVRSDAEATRQRNIAISQQVANRAEELRATNPALAAQLALGAYRLAPTAQTRSAVLGALSPTYATTLTGHDGNVNAVALSRNGHLLATASRDRTAQLWDVTDPHHPRRLATLTGHTNNVSDVAFSPDGRLLATTSWDHTAKLWHVATGTEIATLHGHTDGVESVAFSPAGHLLATGGADNAVILWDATGAPRVLNSFTAHDDDVLDVQFAPSRPVLGTTGRDGTVTLWDLSDPVHVRERRLTGHTGPVPTIAFSPDGSTAATGGDDRTVRLWPTSGDGPPRVLTGHTDGVRSVTYHPDGRYLVSTGVDRTVRLWRPTDLDEPVVLAGHTDRVVATAFSQDGRTLATGSDDHTVRLWDIQGGALLGHRDSVYGAAVAPSGRIAATASYDRTVRLWDLTTGAELAVLDGGADAVNSVAFSPDGHVLAAAGADRLVHRWDVADPTRPRGLPPLAGHTDAVNSVAYSPDGRVLATGSTDRTVRLWSARSGAELARMTGHADSVESVAFNRTGSALASGSADFTIRLWDVPRRRAAATLTGHTQAVKSVAFSPDGRVLASGGSDRTARLWRPADGTEIARLTEHADTVHAVAFSPDGRLLATASADRRTRLWRLADVTEIAELAGHEERVYALAFTPDGHTLLTGSGDHTTHLVEVAPEHAANRICATVWPPLTRQDWHEHFGELAYQPPC
jgi:WD40 repeat protein